MSRLIGKFVRNARGATAVEYGLIVALLVIAIISGVSALGGATGNMWNNMSAKVVSVQP